jgi:methyl-accepting chemotaxis protein
MNQVVREPSRSLMVGQADGHVPALWAFFRYHGVWAPGVRLFRRLSFQAKASIVSVAFLIPLVVLAWSFNARGLASLQFDDKEREGVRQGRALTGFVAAVAKWQGLARGDEGALGALQTDAEKALQSFETARHAPGAALADAASVQALQSAWQSLKSAAGNDVTGMRTLQDAAQARGLETLAQVVDASNLSLDPALGSYYLMDAVAVAAPDLVHQIVSVRERLLTLAGVAQLSQADMLALDREANALAGRLAQIATSMGKAGGEMPELGARERVAELQAHVQPLLTLAQARVGGAGEQGDAGQVRGLAAEALQAGGDFMAFAWPKLDDALSIRQSEVRRTSVMVNALTCVCVLMAGYLLFCFYRVTRGGMEEVRFHLQAMTQGDLTTYPKPWGQDEAASLMLTLSSMQQSLRVVVHDVRAAAEMIVHSSSEIAAGSLDLSGRTERTASSLQASASSMDGIASAVQQTASHAVEAADLAKGNAQVAQEGGEVIGNVVTTMHGIQDSSRRIADIISVIDGIAFQTNILALNAAVEAARAGEQGRGFAVVAGEVRALAQRSASAAREIKTLIEDSVGKVASGSEVVQSAGQTMNGILGNARRMDDLLAQISAAAMSQSTGVGDIGRSVQDLDRVTQENAALVEETAAAAESLRNQAEGLVKAVGAFKLPA